MIKPHCSPYPDYLGIEGQLTDEQKLTRDTVRNFVISELEPLVRDSYEMESFPKDTVKKMGALGLLGPTIESQNGSGIDYISYGLMLRELERCDSAFRSFASVQGSLVMYPISVFGSEEQRATWLPRLSAGESIGCFCLTESSGGSDPASMSTTAIDQGDHWLLNGSKMWITNGCIADIAIVWAKTENGIRGFLVPTNSKGIVRRRMKGKLSLRASVTSEIYFDHVKLSKDAILPKSSGIKSPLSCLTQARFGISWGVLGAAEACFDEAVNYAKDRRLFDKTLDSFQLIQVRLASICTKITHGQLLAYRLGQLMDRKKLHPGHVSMAKQSNVEMALNAARQCRDLLGANGIMLEYKSMRHMCNLETVVTYEGTNDIHLLVVGQMITGKAAFRG